jgi:DNA-directed RNA polymerase subunit RPC12/RpoP
MSARAFNCPYCREGMDSDPAMQGRMINCPSCGGLFRIPGGPPPEDWLVNFDCTECGQNIEAPADASGLNLHCPGCGRTLVIPAPPPAPPPPPTGIVSSAEGELADEVKGSTRRIEMATDSGVPPAPPYHIRIKRTGEGGGHIPDGFHPPSAKPRHPPP